MSSPNVPGGGPVSGPPAGAPAYGSVGSAVGSASGPAHLSQALPRPTAASAPRAAAAPRPRRAARPPRLASLQLRRIDPWTTLKISLIVSIVMFFVWMIAVGAIYLTLDALGMWERINDTYNTLVVSGDSVGMQPDLITPGVVFSFAGIIGAINIVLFTALSAIAAFVYNASAGMAGGVELTLGERD